MVNSYKIVLASNSPRRRELLAGICPEYQVRIIEGIDESYPEDMPADEVPVYISRMKAEPYKASMASDEMVITADTVVVLDGCILGKPHDRGEAVDMLQRLSGRTHHVVTGVTLTTVTRQYSFSCSTEVDFDTLDLSAIEYYVDTFKPMDKAGAYGIQEWIGYVGVTGIRGSYFNVMGLPVQRLYTEMNRFMLF